MCVAFGHDFVDIFIFLLKLIFFVSVFFFFELEGVLISGERHCFLLVFQEVLVHLVLHFLFSSFLAQRLLLYYCLFVFLEGQSTRGLVAVVF